MINQLRSEDIQLQSYHNSLYWNPELHIRSRKNVIIYCFWFLLATVSFPFVFWAIAHVHSPLHSDVSFSVLMKASEIEMCYDAWLMYTVIWYSNQIGINTIAKSYPLLNVELKAKHCHRISRYFDMTLCLTIFRIYNIDNENQLNEYCF